MAKLIYLASPYAHQTLSVAHRRAWQVRDIAGRLLQQGHMVFSPIAHSVGIAATMKVATYDWLALDRVIFERCDELWVLTLDGWRESFGVQQEIWWAKGIECHACHGRGKFGCVKCWKQSADGEILGWELPPKPIRYVDPQTLAITDSDAPKGESNG